MPHWYIRTLLNFPHDRNTASQHGSYTQLHHHTATRPKFPIQSANWLSRTRKCSSFEVPFGTQPGKSTSQSPPGPPGIRTQHFSDNWTAFRHAFAPGIRCQPPKSTYRLENHNRKPRRVQEEKVDIYSHQAQESGRSSKTGCLRTTQEEENRGKPIYLQRQTKTTLITRSVIALVLSRQLDNPQNRFSTSLPQLNLESQKVQHCQIRQKISKVLTIFIHFFEIRQQIRIGTIFFSQHLQATTQ